MDVLDYLNAVEELFFIDHPQHKIFDDFNYHNLAKKYNGFAYYDVELKMNLVVIPFVTDMVEQTNLSLTNFLNKEKNYDGQDFDQLLDTGIYFLDKVAWPTKSEEDLIRYIKHTESSKCFYSQRHALIKLSDEISEKIDVIVKTPAGQKQADLKTELHFDFGLSYEQITQLIKEAKQKQQADQKPILRLV